MSNFDDVETKYSAILKKLDQLRLKGMGDADPEVTKTKMSLRDLLEVKKKNSTAIQKVVPRLTGIRTVTIEDPSTKPISIKNLIGDVDSSVFQNKYAILGVALGVSALLFYILKNKFK